MIRFVPCLDSAESAPSVYYFGRKVHVYLAVLQLENCCVELLDFLPAERVLHCQAIDHQHARRRAGEIELAKLGPRQRRQLLPVEGDAGTFEDLLRDLCVCSKLLNASSVALSAMADASILSGSSKTPSTGRDILTRETSMSETWGLL